MLETYLRQLSNEILKGDTREESFYKHLEKLLLDFAERRRIKNVDITILPKPTESGNPDFRIWDGKNHITGYIEAKAPSIRNLNHIEETDQLVRYINTFPNVILTNFYEFRLYREGELIADVQIARPQIAKHINAVPPVENEKEFFDLLNLFFSYSLPAIKTAKALATELAKRTRFLRDEVISIELQEEVKNRKKALHGFYEAFKNYLIRTITKEQFADLYSQTLTYGLFAARTRADNSFNRELAFKYIPKTIGILKDVFRFISLEDPPKSLKVIVDDIAEVLSVTEVNKILHEYYIDGKGKDPIIHFYETFLTQYDPGIRERRGVYYTPEPVVKYIVRSVHKLLKTDFNYTDGLASEEVTLLDPAGGTLTFPAEAIRIAVEEYKEKYGEGSVNNLIKKQVLPNFYAFELMMAPYAIGHLKIGFLLEELGYHLSDEERFKLFLTNTLEIEELDQIDIPGLSSLSEESHLAGNVKKKKPILVIIGNPPYSGVSANINDWTEKLLKENLDGAQSYYSVDDKPLGERKLWLQDDYVKFLRFAQWKIHQAGFGIVGMITNHSYLDNPTFRGMRQSLMKTFNEIYILDLHGNSLKKETAPDGSKDENVFDIRQGVAIALFIKKKTDEDCKVYHLDRYGLREEKYNWLEKKDFSVRNYKRIKPKSPWYFFIPRDTSKITEYLKWKKINDIFPINVTGIVTARDSFVIGFDKSEIRNRIMQFRNLALSDEIIKRSYGLKDTRGWKLSEVRKDLSLDENWDTYWEKLLYRPFDIRTIYYTPKMVDWGRPEYMSNLFHQNVSICFMRQFSGNVPYSHFLISEHMVDNRTFFSSKGIIQQAPLYIYPDKSEKKKKLLSQILMFEPSTDYGTRKPNISPEIFNELESYYGKQPIAEEILYYVYSIFYSNVYREKYFEYLKIDFPRVPFTRNFKLFKKMTEYGEELMNLHLMKSKLLDDPISKYRGKGAADRIEKITYDEKEKHIYINKEKYFDNIEPEYWNYHIGGYQVLQKYLKDRKGRLMDDPRFFCRIAASIHYTIKLQKKIDSIYEKVEAEAGE